MGTERRGMVSCAWARVALVLVLVLGLSPSMGPASAAPSPDEALPDEAYGAVPAPDGALPDEAYATARSEVAKPAPAPVAKPAPVTPAAPVAAPAPQPAPVRPEDAYWADPAWERGTPDDFEAPDQGKVAEAARLRAADQPISDDFAEARFHVMLGVQDLSFHGSASKVAEYDLLGTHALIEGRYVERGAQPVDVSLRFLEEGDRDLAVDYERDRRLRVEVRDTSVTHNLGHDRLTNLNASVDAEADNTLVTHEDLDPLAEYAIYRSETSLKVKAQPESLARGQSLEVSVRRESRQGVRQSTAISHCGSCHVSARGQSVNESTLDIGLSTTLQRRWGAASYSLLHRKFSNDAAAPLNAYDEALHLPTTPDPVLDPAMQDRLLFQDATLPYSMAPESTKTLHTVKVRRDLGTGKHLYLSALAGDEKNGYTGREAKVQTGSARYTGRRGRKLAYSINGSGTGLDTDAALVVDPGYYQYSALDRRDLRAGADARYQVSLTKSISAGYERREVSRGNFPGFAGRDELDKTTQDRLDLAYSDRINRYTRMRISLQSITSEYPFANYKAAGESMLPDGTPNPLPAGSSDADRRDSRWATLSNQPTMKNSANVQLTWAPRPDGAYFLQARAMDARNGEVSPSRWSQQAQTVSVGAWRAITPRFTANLALMYNRQHTETPFWLPVLEGEGGFVFADTYGSLSTQGELDSDSRSVLLDLDYRSGPKLSHRFSASYNQASSAIGQTLFDLNQLGNPAVADYAYDFSQMGSFSDTDVAYWNVSLSREQQFNHDKFARVSIGYRKYNDKQSYLEDVSGSATYVTVALGRRF